MNALLGSLRWIAALAYLDDIIVFAKSITQHAKDLELLLQRAIKIGLKFSPPKCHFGYSSLKLLGRVVGREGLSIERSRAQAVIDMKEPTNMKELYTAIGMFGSYRVFIHKFAIIAAPLTSITTGNKFRNPDGSLNRDWQSRQIQWGEPQRQAYKELKRIIASEPVLAFPDFKLRFYLYIDACKTGFALAIHQRFPKVSSSFPIFEPITEETSEDWKKATLEDKLFGPIARDIDKHPDYKLKGNILILRRLDGEKFCVPEKMIPQVFHDVHDALNHPGLARSWDQCSRQFYRPGLSVNLKEYIRFCPTCLRTKPKRRPSEGNMPDHEIEPVAFKTVAMDFVTGLPLDNGHDCIFLIVDVWSKMTILIPTSSNYIAVSVANDFFQNVVRRGFLPCRFISDNDKVFLSAFWQHLVQKLHIKCHFTSPYHAQADPAERYNQTMESMLRAYTLNNSDGWVQGLLSVEVAINSLKSTVTGYSPYEMVYTSHSGPTDRMRQLQLDASKNVEDVDDISTLARERLLDAQRRLIQAHERSKAYYDSKHSPIIPFKVGDWAMIKLSLRPIKIANQSKLTEPLLGPYKVLETHTRSVVLDIPKNFQIHPRFSIQHVEHCPTPDDDPFNRPLRPSPVEVIGGEDAYEVESIIGKRTFGRLKHVQYLVKWKGYSASEATWEFAKDLIDDGCQDTINQFENNAALSTSDVPPTDRIRIHSSPPRSTANAYPSASKPISAQQKKHFSYDQPLYTERPVCFESRVTRDYESRYLALELELACLTWAVLKSLKYLEGQAFTVFTDHENIRSVLNSKSETLYSRQVDRFRMLLMPYISSMTIEHRPGKLHHNVDALSRLVTDSTDPPNTVLPSSQKTQKTVRFADPISSNSPQVQSSSTLSASYESKTELRFMGEGPCGESSIGISRDLQPK